MKRLLIIVLLFFLIPLAGPFVPSVIKEARAQDLTNVAQQYPIDMDACRSGQMNVNCYVYMISMSDFNAFTCGVLTTDQCTSNPKLIPFLNRNSVVSDLAMGIDFMYQNQPADFGYWARDTAVSLGFQAPPAYAQGTGLGFQGLGPLLPVWKAFRNIAYLILALVMIVVGFLVMVRKRIDPKTVVTVQNSIPRIVMALILITFSYAIVGLMIDLMYLVMGFIGVVFKGAFPITAAQSNPLCGGGFLSSITRPNLANPGLLDFAKAVFMPLLIALSPACHATIQLSQGISIGQVASDFIMGLVGLPLTGLLGFILALAYLFAFIRILLLLLNCYVQILLAVLIGPLQLLLDAFPGGNGFTSWIKNLVANLVPFPITAFMFLLGNALLFNINSNKMWTAPFLPQPWGVTIPLIGTIGGMGGVAESIITLGIMLTIPSVVNGIKEQLKTKSPVEVGAGTFFSPLGKAAGTGLQTAYQISMIKTGFGGIAGFLGGNKEGRE